MSIEAMKQMLDALQYIYSDLTPHEDQVVDEAIQAGRTAIEQTEKQEPVAWITDGGKGELWWHQSVKFDDDGNLIGENPDDIPLYTAPPQCKPWVNLTAEEIWQCNRASAGHHVKFHICVANQNVLDFAKTIEAKLKEKNT